MLTSPGHPSTLPVDGNRMGPYALLMAMPTDRDAGLGHMLVLERVNKQYGRVHAVHDVSLTMHRGVWGLVGPNGAGKSTLLAMLATLTRPTSGTVMWDGVDIHRRPESFRAVLGYMPQHFGVYPNLTPVEFLHYMAAVKGISGRTAEQRIELLMNEWNLMSYRARPLGTCSTGTRQRVGIATALLNDPRILLIDEPTAGLDPEERLRFRHLLADLSGDRLVVLSTHIVSDIEATATNIAVMHGGRLLTAATPESLLHSVEGVVWSAVVSSEDMTDVRRRWLISSSVRRSDGVHLRIVSRERPLPSAHHVPPTLEDAYLFHVQQRARDQVGMMGDPARSGSLAGEGSVS